MKAQTEFYKNIFTKEYFEDNKMKRALKFRADAILEFTENNIVVKKSSKIADIGSSTGWLSNEIKDKFGIKPVAIDFSPQAAKLAKKLYGIETKVSDFDYKLPFQSGYFDVAFCVEVIEHVLNPDFLLEEIRRILKPGGFLILTTPNLAYWCNRLFLLTGYQPIFSEVSTKRNYYGLGILKKIIRNYTPAGHLRLFTLPALLDILNEEKFQVVAQKGLPLYGFVAIMQVIEDLFAKIPSLSSDILVIAKKS